MALLERLLCAFARRYAGALSERLVYHVGGSLARRAGPGATRVALVDGAHVIVPFDDPALRRFYFTGRFDDPLQEFAREVLRPGDVAIDVGANLGAHTMLFGALVGPSGLVYAFEPNPNVAAVLRSSVELNGWQRVEVRELALSDSVGESELRLTPGPATMSSLAERLWLSDGQVVTVPTATLDGELASAPRARLLKIDVEGWELHVLRGAQGIFSRLPPAYVAIEVVFEESESAHPLLTSWGYELIRTAAPDAFYRRRA